MTGNFLLMNPLSFPILSTTVFLPLVGGIIIMFLKRDRDIKVTALTVGIITFLVSLALFSNFKSDTKLFQFGEYLPWIPSYKINYILGIDGITIFLILLTTILTPICVLCSWTAIKDRIKGKRR